jgi:hypothetical protein
MHLHRLRPATSEAEATAAVEDGKKKQKAESTPQSSPAIYNFNRYDKDHCITMDNYVFCAICLAVHSMELTLAPLCVAVSETLTKCMDNYV